MESNNKIKQCLDKVFGGLSMSWVKLIIFSVVIAVVTALFLIIPFFGDTSFERVGVHLEAWILFAVIIMSNCKKPLESALKVFVFFLISQPLIYLIQVPFSWMGWDLFSFYSYWFKITLCTFPAAFVGWFITKKNWISALILLPVIAFLGLTTYQCGVECIKSFPHLILATIFCILQIVVYVIVFFPIKKGTNN